MKRLIIILFLIFTLNLSATIYYVAPSGGNDGNAGTNIAAPWATWQKAFTTAVAGDTVFFRGGIYYTTAQVYKANGSGTKTEPICFFNYPNEKPILDGIKKTVDAHGIYITGVSYIYFKGLTVRNNFQKTIGSQVQGFLIANCSNISFKNCVSHNNGYRGFNLFQTDTAYFYNCDSYRNSDTLSSGPGNGGDGFNFWGYDGNTASYVIVRGCRAWGNSDDGFDTNYDGYVEYDSCWAFNNGNLLSASEGQGFKLGLKENNAAFLTRKVSNCIMAFNANTGLTTNEDPNDARFVAQAMHIYNNTSYHNGYHPNHPAWGWGYSIVNSYESSDAVELSRIFRNNIAYDNAQGPILLWPNSLYTHSNNSWDISPVITLQASDFLSLDSTGVTGPRQSDGSLPDLNFLKLNNSSDLIDAGVDIGLPYNGSAPDLGAFEYGEEEPSDATDILTFTFTEQTGSATINATLHTVSIEVEWDAVITSLTPTITLSSGATIDPTSGTARNFTNPVPYTVTAEDTVTEQVWTVTVTQEAEPSTGIKLLKSGTKLLKKGTKFLK